MKMKAFPVADVLTVTTGYSLADGGMIPVRGVIGWMVGEDDPLAITDTGCQLAARNCVAGLYQQYPELIDMHPEPGEITDGASADAWVEKQIVKLGRSELVVARLRG